MGEAAKGVSRAERLRPLSSPWFPRVFGLSPASESLARESRGVRVIVLVSGATKSIPTAPLWVGRLVIPRDGTNPKAVSGDERPWAIDNGVLSGFKPHIFLALLERFRGVNGCLFVAAPDVVERTPSGIMGDAAKTLEQFHRWATVIRAFGYPVALVAQDGIRLSDVPWDDLDAIFIGGGDTFKTAKVTRDIVAVARAKGKHAHMGRVAGPQRYWHAQEIGIQSIDSSGFSRFFNAMRRRRENWHRRPRLPLHESEPLSV